MRHSRMILDSLRTLCFAGAAVTLVAAMPARPGVPGTTYTMRQIAAPGGPSGLMSGMVSDWAGTVVYASGRGRMDITEGSQRGLFEKGDYVLFDSTDFIIVQTSSKTFFGIPKDMLKRLFGMGGAMGQIAFTFSDITVTLDTLGAGETIEGFPTQHFRLTTKYTMSIDMSAMGADAAGMAPPPIVTSATSEYWMTDKVRIPSSPFMGVFGGGSASSSLKVPPDMFGGAMKELMMKQSAATAGLPSGMATLKTVTTQSLSGSPVMSGESQHTLLLGNIKSTDVDPDQLVLPAGFTETTMPAMAALPDIPMSADGGAKWRAKPPM